MTGWVAEYVFMVNAPLKSLILTREQVFLGVNTLHLFLQLTVPQNAHLTVSSYEEALSPSGLSVVYQNTLFPWRPL